MSGRAVNNPNALEAKRRWVGPPDHQSAVNLSASVEARAVIAIMTGSEKIQGAHSAEVLQQSPKIMQSSQLLALSSPYSANREWPAGGMEAGTGGEGARQASSNSRLFSSHQESALRQQTTQSRATRQFRAISSPGGEIRI